MKPCMPEYGATEMTDAEMEEDVDAVAYLVARKMMLCLECTFASAKLSSTCSCPNIGTSRARRLSCAEQDHRIPGGMERHQCHTG